ncbi:MAG: PHP-associated domain-containing protein [Candidatus Thermoplasmatota archaeon]|nr:PHP-associated domain-containing protein [Candidatus Thermoplasmatota archaeon]
MFDLHVHTYYSDDGHEKPEKMAGILKKKGFRGMAITDHNTMKGALKRYDLDEFIIIPGTEISTDRGHLLGLGMREEIKGRKVEESIEEIHDKGGIAILPHPCRIFSGAIKNFDGLKLDGIETFNARSFPSQNKRAGKLAKTMKLPETGGSDAHYAWEVGKGYTTADAESVDDVIEEILKKRTKTGGAPSIIRPLKSSVMALSSYTRRGFRRV